MTARHAALQAAGRALDEAGSLNEALQLVTEKARELVGAHQATTSLVGGEKWAQAIHAISLSEKYAAWREYDERPDGSGIYHLVSQLSRPMRLTQVELEAHPAWRGFGKAADRHPPMRGWLAAPLTGRAGRTIGLIQLSDKYDGEFTGEDEGMLVDLARLASNAIENIRRRSRAQRRVDRSSSSR